MAPGMHGAILSTSSSTSQARSGGTGTVNEWSISMAMVRHSLWLDSISELCLVSVRVSKDAAGPAVRPSRGSCRVQHPEALGQASVGQAGLPGQAGSAGS